MEKINNFDFEELHKQKIDEIFEAIGTLSEMKESDTMLPTRFFKEINDDVIRDYKSKMRILNKNTRFVTCELNKDFRMMRRVQRRKQAELRRQWLKDNGRG